MAKPDRDTLYVAAATYDDVDAAVADYDGVKELYRAIRSSHDFDAAVIAKDADGKVSIVKKHEQPTRHGAAVGLGWGPAGGGTAGVFPPPRPRLVPAASAGAPLGGGAGLAAQGAARRGLKEVRETRRA